MDKSEEAAAYESSAYAYKSKLDDQNMILEERILRQIDQIKNNPNFDPRCAAEANTCIQTGFMWLKRALYKPQRIGLPEDEE